MPSVLITPRATIKTSVTTPKVLKTTIKTTETVTTGVGTTPRGPAGLPANMDNLSMSIEPTLLFDNILAGEL